MTDRLEEIQQRNAKVRGFNTELDADWDWLITEVERLTHLHNLDHSLADQWQKDNERLRGMMEKDSIRTREHNILVEENRTLTARLAEVVNIYPEMEQIANYKATIAALQAENIALEGMVDRGQSNRLI